MARKDLPARKKWQGRGAHHNGGRTHSGISGSQGALINKVLSQRATVQEIEKLRPWADRMLEALGIDTETPAEDLDFLLVDREM